MTDIIKKDLAVMLRTLSILLFTLTTMESSWAKGLDELKPDAEAADAAGTETDESKATVQEPAQEAASAAPAVTAEVSASAAKIAGKLALEAGYGWARVSAGKGDWRANGMSDVALKYKYLSPGFDLWATARFAPYDVTVESDAISYRGTINGYHLGSEAHFPVGTKLSAFGGAELGVMAVYLDDIIDLASDTELEENGANFSLHGGLNWQALEKFAVGPRLNLGFGRFSVVQFSAAASFLF